MAWDVIFYATAEGSVPGADFLELTPEESAEFWREHEPHMLPPDDEP